METILRGAFQREVALKVLEVEDLFSLEEIDGKWILELHPNSANKSWIKTLMSETPDLPAM